MPRTTTTQVQALLETGEDYDTENSPDLTQFVDSATALMDRVVACATAKGRPLTDTEAELVERWLAAHLYAMSDQPYASKSTGKASASFQGQTGMYGEATKYGQTAMSLDYSGCLAGLLMKKRAGGFWAGKAPSEQTDYSDRD